MTNGGVITQQNRPIAFFSRKLSETQQKYSVTEIEILAIVETLKEFKGILWGQLIKVYRDHKYLIQNALGLTSDRVYCWRLLLEEFGPEIIHIKNIHDTVAGAISCHDYNSTHTNKENCMTFTQCWCHYVSHTAPQQPAVHQNSMNLVFANRSKGDVINPLTVQQIVEAQLIDTHLHTLACDNKFTTKVVENTQVLCKGMIMVPPSAFQHRAISW